MPDGSILISDGELGLSEAFAEYVSEQQRCHWHIPRDLYHMMYQDGARKKDTKPLQYRFAILEIVKIALIIPEGDIHRSPRQRRGYHVPPRIVPCKGTSK